MSNDEWTTPKWLFDWLKTRVPFMLDAAATHENHLCDGYYHEGTNGLQQDWTDLGWTFCNPPYSNVGEWVEKAASEYIAHGRRSLLLCPVRSDQDWWHQFVVEGVCDVEWYRGRISFGNSKGSAWMYNVNLVFGRPAKGFVPSIDAKGIRRIWEFYKTEEVVSALR